MKLKIIHGLLEWNELQPGIVGSKRREHTRGKLAHYEGTINKCTIMAAPLNLMPLVREK